MTDTVVYPARRIHTVNRSRPEASAVAVRDGRILAVGDLDEVTRWGEHTVDDRFADLVLVPGFVEAHSHLMTGGIWQHTYVGFFDRRGPDGRLWQGCRSIDEVVERLADAEGVLEPGRTLLAWGLDPIYFPGERLVARHLDRASAERPILVMHASGHLSTVNTALMARAGIDASTDTPGVVKGPDGNPVGELQEPAAMGLAREAMGELASSFGTEEALWNFARMARNAGHTLVTDLGTRGLHEPDVVAGWRRVVDDPTFPVRMAPTVTTAFGGPTDPELLADVAVELRATSSDKLRFGVIKLILDGSIQGFTARLDWPFYFDPPDGHPGNGLWLIPPDQVADIVAAFHRRHLTVHAHCNGDQAAEVFIDAVERVLSDHPWPDHRHTAQHCQLTRPAQYRRMGRLGMCANLFTNHLYYWGDQHRDVTVGPERAAGMDACGTALAAGVPLSFHSDSPITPLGHLHTAWCAVNRRTATGDVLGPDERISVPEALAAATLGGAHQLRLDDDLGSIEVGKLADFAVLADDPLTVDPEALKDIDVWGTVLGGVPFEAD